MTEKTIVDEEAQRKYVFTVEGDTATYSHTFDLKHGEQIRTSIPEHIQRQLHDEGLFFSS